MTTKVEIKPSTTEPTSTSDVSAFWRLSSVEGTKPVAGLIAPLDGYFVHNVFDVGDNNSRRVRAGSLRVAPRARGNNIGDKLVRGLGALSQEYAFPEIYVCLASQYSLDIFERVFSRERMSFRGVGLAVDLNSVVKCPPVEELGISFEQARAILVGLEQAEKDLEDRQLGFPVVVDLDGLDMSNWSLPMEYDQDSIDIESIRPKVVPNP